MILKRMHSIFT